VASTTVIIGLIMLTLITASCYVYVSENIAWKNQMNEIAKGWLEKYDLDHSGDMDQMERTLMMVQRTTSGERTEYRFEPSQLYAELSGVSLRVVVIFFLFICINLALCDNPPKVREEIERFRRKFEIVGGDEEETRK
jgi:hypothetical protein